MRCSTRRRPARTRHRDRPLLDRLSAQFDLLAFDYRGMGRSAPVTEPYAMADVAADVAALLDAVGWDRTVLAGLSYGGMVAQEFAVTLGGGTDLLSRTSPNSEASPARPAERGRTEAERQ
jgi:3-oxoadipate enol-lactonase